MKYNRQLTERIAEVAEVAGYLWQKGWAERNGGNISYNITDVADDALRALPPLGEPVALARPVENLCGHFFLVTGTNRRMRYVCSSPMDNMAVIRISDDGRSYAIVAEKYISPTSELPSPLSIHDYLLGRGRNQKVVIHTHPIELVAMTHNAAFLGRDVLSRLLWSMIPETRAFCPKGVGIVPYALPGSIELADATIAQLDDYDVVLWEKHGALGVGENVIEPFDMIDTLSKSAQIYMSGRAMGFTPAGMSDAQMQQLKEAFNL